VVAVETVAASVVSLPATPIDPGAPAAKPPAAPRTFSLAIAPAKRGRISLCLSILPLGYRHPRTLSIRKPMFWKKIAGLADNHCAILRTMALITAKRAGRPSGGQPARVGQVASLQMPPAGAGACSPEGAWQPWPACPIKSIPMAWHGFLGKKPLQGFLAP